MLPGFTLFPATLINADALTNAFDCSAIEGFYATLVLAGLGASQGCKPVLQMRLPDDVTWVVLNIPTAHQLANGTYIYAFGKPGDTASNSGSEVTEAHPVSLPRVCRFNLDVVNVANCTATLHISPFA